MGGLKSMEKWQAAGLAQRDKVHLTRAGYLLLGDMLYEALEKELYRPVAPLRPAASRPDSAVKPKPKPTDTATGEKPLPRGLRRKASTPRHATIQPPTSDTLVTTVPADDRFPYISQ